MIIGIASDHRGFKTKKRIIRYLQRKKIEYIDYGTTSTESVDYNDYALKVCKAINSNKVDCGILICGTGNGMAMSANKHEDIRAGLCWSKEIAALVRQHNNANILVMPARFIPAETAYEIFDTFFHTDFEGGRHQRRIDKINISHGE